MERLAAQRRYINESRPTKASMSGGVFVSEATDRRWKRSSLACWRLEAGTESLMCPLSKMDILLEVMTLGGSWTWAWGIGKITVIPNVPLTLVGRRESESDREGDVKGTVARSEVDAEMSNVKA